MIDPRGPRIGAAITTVVLALVLLTGSRWLLAAQAVVFAVGAIDITRQPYGLLYKHLIRRRLQPPRELEAKQPPQFAQAVGFGFAAVALVGLLSGLTALGYIATGFALAAAFLNAAFGYCLGCEVYLLLKRITGPASPSTASPSTASLSTQATTHDTSTHAREGVPA